MFKRIQNDISGESELVSWRIIFEFSIFASTTKFLFGSFSLSIDITKFIPKHTYRIKFLVLGNCFWRLFLMPII